MPWEKLFCHVRERTRHARYFARPDPGQAPKYVDCVTLVAWIYGLLNIHLVEWVDVSSLIVAMKHSGSIAPEMIVTPALYNLIDCGVEVDGEYRPGDIIIAEGLGKYHHAHYGAVGHVGIVTDIGTVIHATRRKGFSGVQEEPLEEFLVHHGPIRTIRRVIY